MRIIFIADNRCRTNFGCRGTSIALSQLMSKKHDIVSVVTGTYTLKGGGAIFYIPLLPKFAYSILTKMPRWNFIRNRWCTWVSKSKKRYKQFDFISESPQKSIENFKKCLLANPHLEEFNIAKHSFDGIVINGEGTMIMSTPARRDTLIYMMFMQWALNLGKKVYLVNAMFSDCPRSPRNHNTIKELEPLLIKCKYVSARDSFSFDYISNNMPKVNIHYFPDALFTWKQRLDNTPKILSGSYILPFGAENDLSFDALDFSTPYICVSGSSAAAWTQESAYLGYKKFLERLKKEFNIPIYLIEVCPGDKFLHRVGRDLGLPCVHVQTPILAGAKILSNAALYISGRFHPSILASLGGTPCVFFGSNSHKTMSLQTELLYDEVKEFSAIPQENEFDDIIRLAESKIKQGSILREKVLGIAQLRSDEAEELVSHII